MMNSVLHGSGHSERVEKFGLYLAEKNGADRDVVRYFAKYHDSGRENDGVDDGHGQRSSEYVKKLYNENKINLDEKQLEKVVYSIIHHSESNSYSDDITIQTCWDADRLDLWRVGIEPDPNRMLTEAGKDPDTIKKAGETDSHFF